MGDFFSSKTKEVETPFETNPWAPQQSYLKDGFKAGKAGLDQSLASINSIQDWVANLTPDQKSAIGVLGGTGKSMVNRGAGIADQGMQGLGGFDTYADNAGSLYAEAGQDRTGDIISGAEQFADNPYTQQMIDQSIADVRTGFDRTVGDINSAASGSGNINSTRAGALEARALDDSMDRAAEISTGIRGAAYADGLDRSTGELNRSFSDRVGMNEAIRTGASDSLGLFGAGNDTVAQGIERLLSGGGMVQGQNQNEITGKMTGPNMTMDMLNKYMKTVGGNYGNEGFTTSIDKTQSPFQTLVGGATTAMGMGWKPFG